MNAVITDTFLIPLSFAVLWIMLFSINIYVTNK